MGNNTPASDGPLKSARKEVSDLAHSFYRKQSCNLPWWEYQALRLHGWQVGDVEEWYVSPVWFEWWKLIGEKLKEKHSAWCNNNVPRHLIPWDLWTRSQLAPALLQSGTIELQHCIQLRWLQLARWLPRAISKAGESYRQGTAATHRVWTMQMRSYSHKNHNDQHFRRVQVPEVLPSTSGK